MLYPAPKQRKPRSRPCCPAEEQHYFDSAEELHRLERAGYSRAEMAQITGLNVAQVCDRLRLPFLEDGLRIFLRQAGAPERIALLLLALPDPMTRRRLAHRIVREQLCIRDAALLVDAAQRHGSTMPDEALPPKRIITVVRDVRLYRNAIRDIAEQMKNAGVRASYSERRAGGIQELTVAYPARRRRTERYQSMYT